MEFKDQKTRIEESISIKMNLARVPMDAAFYERVKVAINAFVKDGASSTLRTIGLKQDVIVKLAARVGLSSGVTLEMPMI